MRRTGAIPARRRHTSSTIPPVIQHSLSQSGPAGRCYVGFSLLLRPHRRTPLLPACRDSRLHCPASDCHAVSLFQDHRHHSACELSQAYPQHYREDCTLRKPLLNSRSLSADSGVAPYTPLPSRYAVPKFICSLVENNWSLSLSKVAAGGQDRLFWCFLDGPRVVNR